MSRRVFILVSALCLLGLAPSPVNAAGFAEHLNEAIANNRSRMQPYAVLSQGRSRVLSQAWIAAELASLPIAHYLDHRAKVFQRAGIPVMELDFILMSLTPPFSAELLPEIPASVAYPEVPWRTWKKRILELAAERNFVQLHAEIAIWLKELEAAPRFHAVLRHVLESCARAAFLAPQYERLAIQRNVGSSPVPLSQWLLYLHAKGMWAAHWLDARAEPMQRQGIQILTRDVPPIEMSPIISETYSFTFCPREITGLRK